MFRLIPTRRFRAFTLIELLVVVTIIAVLIALILPAIGKAKARAQATACLSQNRGLGVAFAAYAFENNNVNMGSEPGLIWDVYWPTYYRQYVINSNNSSANASKAMRCNRNTSGTYGMYAAYGGLASPNLDAEFMVYGVSWYGYSSYYYTIRNPRPSDFLLFACSSAGQGVSPGQAKVTDGWASFQANMFWSGGSAGCQGLWLAHPIDSVGVASALFADGHGELVGPDRLTKVYNRTSSSNPLSSGFSAWKRHDGWRTTNKGVTYVFP